ncbi:MAG TPA: helicase [Candidatus Latescibacteria bacterium]|nr:helicase [Candidatus Latescibacterota bacterium]
MGSDTTEWATVHPLEPYYAFAPKDVDVSEECERLWSVHNAVPLNGVGMTTARDHFVIDFDEVPLVERARLFRDMEGSDESVCRELNIPLKIGWDMSKSRRLIQAEIDLHRHVKTVLYRPFDARLIFYHDSLVWRTVKQIMHHMLAGENVALLTGRAGQVIDQNEWSILFCTRYVTEFNLFRRGGNNLFPLYLYPVPEQNLLFREESHWPPGPGGRRPNLSPEFVEEVAGKIGMRFVSDGTGNLQEGGTFGPEDVLHYMYGVFHSPAYRCRYAEYLKTDFPRLPLTSDRELFAELCRLGRRLVALHLMKEHGDAPARYPVAGSNVVERVEFSPVPLTPSSAGAEAFPSPDGRGETDAAARPGSPLPPLGEEGSAFAPANEGVMREHPTGRVWINKTQYFEGVPEDVWEFHIGGYQVCHKWLKDRKGRTLTFDDIQHYCRVVAALGETIRLMEQIDDVIEEHGGFPFK